MTLHEAIEQVLLEANSPLSPSEIAVNLNTNKYYVKGDGSQIRSNQISARINKYPTYFTKKDGLVYLRFWIENGQTKRSQPQSLNKSNVSSGSQVRLTIDCNPSNSSFLIENKYIQLDNLGNLLNNGLPKLNEIDSCGIYAISIPKNFTPSYFTPEEALVNGNVLNPWPISKLEDKWVDESDIIYYGLAGKLSFRTLKERLNDLLRHGNGKTSSNGPHKGGEILWQVKEYNTFNIWILPTSGPPAPRQYEEKVLRQYHQINKKLPFANRQF